MMTLSNQRSPIKRSEWRPLGPRPTRASSYETMSTLRAKPQQPIQAKRQKSFAFTDNNGASTYAFFPVGASTMEIAKAIFKDSGAACWPLTIDGIPLAQYNFDEAEDIIHEVEWSPTQSKIIEEYRKALEKAIAEAQRNHQGGQEPAPVLSNVSQPNRGPKGGAEAEQVQRADGPYDEAGWRAAKGHRKHGDTASPGSEGVHPFTTPVEPPSKMAATRAPAGKDSLSANPNDAGTQSATAGPNIAGSKYSKVAANDASSALSTSPMKNRSTAAGSEQADDWSAAPNGNTRNSKLWLDSNKNQRGQNGYQQDDEEDREVHAAGLADEKENRAGHGEDVQGYSQADAGRKNKKATAKADRGAQGEAISTYGDVEVEDLFADLIIDCLQRLDDTVGAITKKKIELLEEKARIERSLTALEKRLDQLKSGANDIIEPVDPYEEDIEALKENL